MFPHVPGRGGVKDPDCIVESPDAAGGLFEFVRTYG